MDVNAAIIDQRVSALVEEIRQRAADELGISNDGPKLKSVAFVFLCVRTLLDLDFDEAFDCLVEGGQDFGVDAIHVTEERDGEFSVTLFQGKYKGNLDGSSGFPGTGIEKLVQAVRHLFDPSSTLQTINHRLRTRLEEVRSMIRDGFIPRVRVIACNKEAPQNKRVVGHRTAPRWLCCSSVEYARYTPSSRLALVAQLGTQTTRLFCGAS